MTLSIYYSNIRYVNNIYEWKKKKLALSHETDKFFTFIFFQKKIGSILTPKIMSLVHIPKTVHETKNKKYIFDYLRGSVTLECFFASLRIHDFKSIIHHHTSDPSTM